MILSREFWLEIRQGLLFILAAIERLPGVDISPTTKELRDMWKSGIMEGSGR